MHPKNCSNVEMSVVKLKLRTFAGPYRPSVCQDLTNCDDQSKPTKGSKILIFNAALWPLLCEPCANPRTPATSESRVMREEAPQGTKPEIKISLNPFLM